MAGKSVYLMEKFSPELAVKTIREESIEFFFAVPTHMQRILGLADITQADFDSVIGMYHSGAQCPPSIKRKWLSLVGAERVWEIYGATDGAGFTVIRGDDWLNHPGSVGRPVGTEILILDDEGEEVPRGVVGSIFMAPLLRPGGGRDPTFSYIGADLPPLIRGRFRTAGDMGWLDKLGYLHIADRRTDMIITGGANVFPAEVEAALIEHPAVDEVAVIGISDPEWGHRVHAVVKPVDPAYSDWKRLDEFCRQRLAPYKRPKSYEFVKTLPRTEVGKISRAQLTRERVACDASGCSKRSAAQ
jgi:bile acid-coenzyme A ligase